MKMAGQKKWGKKGYLQDFKRNAGEGYTYTGDTWLADGTERKRLLKRLWALQLLSLIAVILPGFLTTAGLQNTFYVILPYVLWLVLTFYQVYMLGSMTFGGNPLRNYVYQRTVERFLPCAAVCVTGAGLTAAGLFIFLAGGGGGEGAAVCFVCVVLQGVYFFLVRKSSIKEIWTRTGRESESEAMQ